MSPIPRALKLFYSYAKEDDELQQLLSAHLAGLKREGLIESWAVREVLPGNDRLQEAQQELENADIVLFLISSSFMNSDYLNNIEVTRAFVRHNNKETRIVPILLKPVFWKTKLFTGIHPLPVNGVPVTLWPQVDEAFTEIARGLHGLIISMSH